MTYRTVFLVLTLTAVTPAVAPAQAWTLKPDPPAEKADWKPDAELKLPSWTGEMWEGLVFAEQQGPFAATGSKKAGWTVYDLRTSKPVGSVDPGLVSSRPVLSRDGTRLAGVDPEAPPHAFRFGPDGRPFEVKKDSGVRPEAMVVADTTTGKQLCRIPIQTPTYPYYCFVGRDKMVVRIVNGATAKDMGVVFLDLKAGTAGALVKDTFGFTWPVASPTGRYIALDVSGSVYRSIAVLSPQDETVLARLTIPLVAQTDPPVSERDRTFATVSLQFSPDGSRLGAVVYHRTVGYRVYSWRLDNGVQGEVFDVKEARFDTPMLQWSVDGSAVLLGNRVVADPEAGKVLWTLPHPTSPPRPITPHSQRLLLTADRALGVEAVNRDKSEFRLVVHTRP